jgi:transcriptional regulator with PAS, ATPase and Fis domain
VLVGRTGTGKERFARALHCHDGAERPFHAINCAALPPPLVEAELFGYRKGAFTGAERSHAGHLLAAHGGTLFLDEVAELELPVQAKLLRALETGEIPRLGETGDRRFQARIVAACQVPLTDLVAARRFRDDLAARLSGLIVTVPALCDRRADVPPLFDIFLRRYSGGSAPPVSTRLYETLCLYSWPGNVRELELLARQLLAIHGLEPILRRSHLPATMRESGEERISQSMPTAGAAGQLINALNSAGGNVKKAATIAGMSRQRAYRLIQSERLASMVAASRGERGGESGRHD